LHVTTVPTSQVTFDWSTLEKPVLDNILRRLFNQLDRDGNGEVSVEELAEIFKGALSWSELEQVCARQVLPSM